MLQRLWPLTLIVLTGCPPLQMTAPENFPPRQVASSLDEPRRPGPIRVNYPPASQDVSTRLVLVKDKLVGENGRFGLRPYVTAIGSPDPEIFHVDGTQIFITEGLVRQCQSDGQLAAVLANEMGRIVSEREAAVIDEIRQPERLPPITVSVGNAANSRDIDPTAYAERAFYEKAHPRQNKKLPPPQPQQVARTLLESAGYQRTDLDAAWPLLQNAQRYSGWENQFKGTLKQSDWKAP